MAKKSDGSNVTSSQIRETVRNVEKATKKDLTPLTDALDAFDARWQIKRK